jgi:hypothetical protein
MAAGILDQPITAEEVLETGERVQGQFSALLNAVIPRISIDLTSGSESSPGLATQTASAQASPKADDPAKKPKRRAR